MALHTIPDTAAEIDAAWLDEALRAGGLATSARLAAVRPEPVVAAVSLMGEITRFHLD